MNETELAAAREEIDAVDAEMHALLIRRAAAVARVGAAKAGGPTYRPGREAAVLRALLARHHGPFPVASLVAIWREIIGASIAMQGPLRIAVPGGTASPAGLVARAHFGAAAELWPAADAHDACAVVARGDAVLAAVPVETGPLPWWAACLGDDAPPPVLARLPAFRGPGIDPAAGEVLVVGPGAEPPDSAEASVFVLERAGETPDALVAALALGDLPTPELHHGTGPAARLTLALFGAFVPAADARLRRHCEGQAAPVLRIAAAGGYPLPVSSNQRTDA